VAGGAFQCRLVHSRPGGNLDVVRPAAGGRPAAPALGLCGAAMRAGSLDLGAARADGVPRRPLARALAVGAGLRDPGLRAVFPRLPAFHHQRCPGHRPLCGGGALVPAPPAGGRPAPTHPFRARLRVGRGDEAARGVAGRRVVDPGGRGGGRRVARVLSARPSATRARAHDLGDGRLGRGGGDLAGALGEPGRRGAPAPGRSSPGDAPSRLPLRRSRRGLLCARVGLALLAAAAGGRALHGGVALVELLASRPATAGDRGASRARAGAARPPSGGGRRGRRPVSPARRAPARASRRRRLGPGGRWLGRARVAAGGRRLRSCGRVGGAACLARALPSGWPDVLQPPPGGCGGGCPCLHDRPGRRAGGRRFLPRCRARRGVPGGGRARLRLGVRALLPRPHDRCHADFTARLAGRGPRGLLRPAGTDGMARPPGGLLRRVAAAAALRRPPARVGLRARLRRTDRSAPGAARPLSGVGELEPFLDRSA